MKMGDFAARAGVGHGTVYFYEKMEMLFPTERNGRGNRHYDEAALDNLNMILFLKENGYNLDSIKDFLESYNFDYTQQKNIKKLNILEKHAFFVREKIKKLKEFQRKLDKKIELCSVTINSKESSL